MLPLNSAGSKLLGSILNTYTDRYVVRLLGFPSGTGAVCYLAKEVESNIYKPSLTSYHETEITQSKEKW